ncbi:hypothetical protein [Dickeya zeae]|uniref:hypothetical protein n=1 Tax=Dickeya zeae TaxID=204042 RepID=UPI0012684DAB|nr:hypothetical protein [Dickeya zeae]
MMSMTVEPQVKGRKRRIFAWAKQSALVFGLLIVILVVLLLLAAVLFESDPDGHHVKAWLEASRYGLFVWRLMLYAGTAWMWMTIRARFLRSTPRQAVLKVERLLLLFVVFSEYLAWRTV